MPYYRTTAAITIGAVMYDWHNGGWGPAEWVAMGLMMLVFWGVVAGLVVYVVRNLGHRPAGPTGGDGARHDQALDILGERFARGEIDADEYRARRDLLRSS